MNQSVFQSILTSNTAVLFWRIHASVINNYFRILFPYFQRKKRTLKLDRRPYWRVNPATPSASSLRLPSICSHSPSCVNITKRRKMFCQNRFMKSFVKFFWVSVSSALYFICFLCCDDRLHRGSSSHFYKLIPSL